MIKQKKQSRAQKDCGKILKEMFFTKYCKWFATIALAVKIAHKISIF